MEKNEPKSREQYKPITVTPDGDIHVDVSKTTKSEGAQSVKRFAELISVSELTKIYRLTLKSVLSAYEKGMREEDVIDALERWSRYPVPENVKTHIRDYFKELGEIYIRRDRRGYFVYCRDYSIMNTILHNSKLRRYFGDEEPEGLKFYFPLKAKLKLKKALIDAGLGAIDISNIDITVKVPRSKISDQSLLVSNFSNKAVLTDGSVSFTVTQETIIRSLHAGLDPVIGLRYLLRDVIQDPPPPGFDLFIIDTVNRFGVPVKTAKNRCPVCGSLNPDKAHFCKICGNRFIPNGNQETTVTLEQVNTVDLTEAEFETEVLNSLKPVLVYFYAKSCIPCGPMGKVLENVASEYGLLLKVVKMDIDTSPRLSIRYRISSVPAVLFFKGGEVLNRVPGAVSEETLRDYLNGIILK